MIIRRLRAERVLNINEQGLLGPPARSQVDQATMSLAVVEAWVTKILRLCGRHKKALKQHLVGRIRGFMVTGTMYRHTLGAGFPLALASLARIKRVTTNPRTCSAPYNGAQSVAPATHPLFTT